MLLGLVGIFLPYFPGVILIWGGIFIFGLIENFTLLDQDFIFFISLLAILAFGLEYVERVLYSRNIQKKTCFSTILGAIIGSVCGSFLGHFYWLFVGGLVGGLIGEILAGRDSIFTIETKKYKIISFFGATLLKITLGCVMIMLFLEKIFFKS